MKITKLILASFLLIGIFSCKKKTELSDNGSAVPVIDSISPNNATAGDPSFTLSVYGKYFSSSSIIKWNDSLIQTTYVNQNLLTATINESYIASAAVDSISVFSSTSGNISNKLPFYCGSGQTNPTPYINALSPASVVAGASGFTITVSGNNFLNSSIIMWNGVALSTTFVSVNELTATINASSVANSGSSSVTVFTPSPGGGNSNSLVFTITSVGNNPIPSIISLSPDNVNVGSANFTLVVNGTNFIAGSTINWNGVALTTTFISSTQLSASIPATSIQAAGIIGITVANPVPGGGTSAVKNFIINSSGSTVKRFLFDASKAETSGNADWVIDQDNYPQRIPTPSQSGISSSSAETFWNGALSSWAVALAKLGHAVETLPSSGQITFGVNTNAQDLSNYDVFVIDEPNIKFTTVEKQAIINFVNSGGGLFMISDHTQSDRNNDGWDSPMIWNDLMTNNGIVSNPFGISIDLTNISGTSSNMLASSSNVILHGSQGNVTQLDFNNGATLTTNTTANSTVQGLIWKSGATKNNSNVLCATSTYGTGRIFVIADSSPMDDGTGASGDVLYVDWPLYSHKQLMMNASLWLAKIQ